MSDWLLPPASTMRAARVLVLGDVMLDRYWFGQVHRISPEAPVPVVHATRQEERLGGAANVARNVAALGGQVTLVGLVGADDAADRLDAMCRQAGIVPHWVRDAQAPTIQKLRVIGRSQQLLRVDFEEPMHAEAQQQLIEKAASLIATHDVVVLSDYAKGALADASRLIAVARTCGKPVLVDPKGRDYERYAGASLLTPNRGEMEQAVGPWHSEEQLAEKAAALREQLGLEALLVTRSEQGMTLFTSSGARHEPARAREVFDVSGAGDTVIATLALLRACGLPLEPAMHWANVAGGVVVGKIGTSVVTHEELLEADQPAHGGRA